MGELDNYIFLESSDHAHNRKKIFFITFRETSFLWPFLDGSKSYYIALYTRFSDIFNC